MQNKDFLQIIGATPLVSIDLIVRNKEGMVLLGKRINRPAKGYWFVPGGRIRKNERLADALQRIARAELGLSLTLNPSKLLGAYEHIYDDNFFGEEGVNTHYVVLAYEYYLEEGMQIILDDQHSEAKWWPIDDLLNSPEVHENTKAYFLEAGYWRLEVGI
jgi:colanic acid biosynthesis protein WcaH